MCVCVQAPGAEPRVGARSEAELAAEAARVHDVPRSQWPAEVLEYKRGIDRARVQARRRELEAERLRVHEREAMRRRLMILQPGAKPLVIELHGVTPDGPPLVIHRHRDHFVSVVRATMPPSLAHLLQ